MGPTTTIRVVLADDHPVVRGGVRALLDSLDGFQVVGEAADGDGVVREVQLLRPDVVLMDVRMPGMDGVAATRAIRTVAPGTAVLMLTMYDDDDTVFTAMQAGARGYLLKESGQDDIVRAIRAVVAGEAIFGPGVASRLLGYFSRPGPAAAAAARTTASGDSAFPELTDRERAILDLLAAGRRTTAIAQELYLSPKTVSNHLTSVFAKLEVAGRTEAIIRARESGLGRGR
jgi:DNA-binding NarL/FixJ family response regulator